LFDAKNQKPQPSSYGRWKKIELPSAAEGSSSQKEDHIASDDDQLQESGQPGSFASSNESSGSASPDTDIQKLDEILRKEAEEQEQRVQGQASGLYQDGPVTFDEDESLSALDSMINEIKHKTVADKSAPEEKPQKKAETPDENYYDIITLLKNDPRIDVTELEHQLFTSEGEQQSGEDISMEEAEEEYLRKLEERFSNRKNTQ